MPKARTTGRTTKTASAARAVTFSFSAPGATSVHVVGTFNKWSKTKDTLRKGKDGTWTKTLRLKPGRYEYRFLLNGEQWENDGFAQECCQNEYGSWNCVKVVD